MRFLLSRTRPTNPYRTHCDMLLPLDIFFCDMGLGELETVLPILIGFFFVLFICHCYYFPWNYPCFLLFVFAC